MQYEPVETEREKIMLDFVVYIKVFFLTRRAVEIHGCVLSSRVA